MRDYVGTFWRLRHALVKGEEYLVVSEGREKGTWWLLELRTETLHPAKLYSSWEDLLWVHRYYLGEYFDNHTLEPIELEPWRTEITAL